jgi:hypothetical protein
MKTNVKLFLLLTGFYLVDAFAYGLWSFNANGKIEVIGFAAISMLVFLSGFIAFYLMNAARTQGPVPEDNPIANIEDGDAEAGFYSPWSWWPFVLGLSASMVFASLAIGWWMTFIFVPIALIGVIGLVYEYSRGQHAH